MYHREMIIWTSKSMNSNFKVKLSGCGYHNYVGFAGLCGAVGMRLAFDALTRAYYSDSDVCVVRLRRGLKIEIYSK